MILVDTSAWIEYDRATGSEVHLRVKELVTAKGEIGVTEPVVMELVMGARADARERELRALLARFILLSFDPDSDFDAAAAIYRRCRQVDLTPRGLIDCLIVAVAHRRGAKLLSHDLDMARLAPIANIQLDPASLTA